MSQGILETKNYKKFRVNEFIFETAAAANQALPGDLVEFAGGRVKTIVKRGCHKGIVGVLEVSSKTRYGFTSRGTPIYLFLPWNEAYPPFYVGSNYSTGAPVLAVVDFEAWLPSSNCPRGSCRFIIGPCGDLAAEERGLVLDASPNPWKKPVIPPVLLPRLWTPEEITCGSTFHVDPPGCRDIDDAITFVPLDTGIVEVYIHIADVASLLLTNPSLWKAAELGQSIYMDGKVAAGLFPESIEQACSLLPGTRRPTLTLKFLWSPLILSIGSVTWHHTEVAIKESYTYDSIYETGHAALLKGIASAMASKVLHDSHDWIAQFMIFYNTEAAKVLRVRGEGILRRHGTPDLEVLTRLEDLKIVPSHLAFQSGEYCESIESSVFHWGLQQPIYCHASSPIRRYADCINQVYLLNMLRGSEKETPPYSIESLNTTSRRVKQYERNLTFMRCLLKAVDYTPLEATVIECFEEKVRIWIHEWKMALKIRKPLKGWNFVPSPGAQVLMKIHMNPNQRNWKRKLVIVLETNITDY